MEGVVKFWKKIAVGIEFVKEFKAHVGEIKCVSVSQDGRSFATAGADKTVKIFDVVTFGIYCISYPMVMLMESYRSSGHATVADDTKVYLLGT